MLTDNLFNLLEPIIGTPTTEYEHFILYAVSSFIVIVIVKMLYDLLANLTGLNR